MARHFTTLLLLLIGAIVATAQEPDRRTIERFVTAIRLSDVQRLEEMIEEGFPVSLPLPMLGAPTPLHLAASGPDPGVAKLLIDAGADIYALDEAAFTPFMAAMRRGNWEIADYMIEAHDYDLEVRVGGLVDAGFEDVASPLTYAAMYGEREMVSYLLASGANDQPAAEMLLHATAARQFGVVERYASTEFGLDRPVEKFNDSTALHLANEDGDSEMVRFLLDLGADMLARNRSAMTAFDVSVAIGLYDVSRIYLNEYGYDIDELGPFNRSALFYVTVPEEDLRGVRFLLENGADPNLLQYDGSNYLHVYIGEKAQNSQLANRQLIKLYLDNGFDPSKTDVAGYTFAHTLAMQPEASLFDLLNEFNVDLDVKEDILGATPIGFAIQAGNLETARRLLEMGADPSVPYNSGRSILSMAVENGEEAAVRLLVEYGASLTEADPDGSTPLDHAADAFRQKIGDIID